MGDRECRNLNKMHLLFFVEEPSLEAALINLLPKIIGEACIYQFIVFAGKQNLLNNLANRLCGYASWMPADWRIVVMIDEDREDCLVLKQRLEDAAHQAGLISKSQAQGGAFQILNRIIVEELEAWFIGDVNALRSVYPRLPASLGGKQKFRVPDAVTGGTRENLERLLMHYGYHAGGYSKRSAAVEISKYMNPEENRSHSFQVFVDGLNSIL